MKNAQYACYIVSDWQAEELMDQPFIVIIKRPVLGVQTIIKWLTLHESLYGDHQITLVVIRAKLAEDPAIGVNQSSCYEQEHDHAGKPSRKRLVLQRILGGESHTPVFSQTVNRFSVTGPPWAPASAREDV
jgi:hypothetical protein